MMILDRQRITHRIHLASRALFKRLPASRYLVVGATMTIGIGMTAAPCAEVALLADPGPPAAAVFRERAAITPPNISGEHRDLKALWRDPVIRDYVGLSDYAWDFNAPGGVPGFGPLNPKQEK
jgi:hypothetical protein